MTGCEADEKRRLRRRRKFSAAGFVGGIAFLLCDSRAIAQAHTGTVSGSATVAPELARARAITFRLALEPRAFGTAFPGHPTAQGQKQLGVIGRAVLEWAYDPRIALEAGVLTRLPFALDVTDEAGALPIFALTLRPFGSHRGPIEPACLAALPVLGARPACTEPGLLLRLGSLDIRHGYHPAIVDEARYAYGRLYLEAYNRALLPEARRDFGKDPFLPAEHGVQIVAQDGAARIEGFLDWQLLETRAHREKFAVGLLGRIDTRWIDLSLQFRLVHYGGQIFTRSDPVRFASLDPVRQPITVAIAGTLRPLVTGGGALVVELPVAYVNGRLAQGAGEEPRSHSGLELGVDARMLKLARLGYRFWEPLAREFGFVSEDGDPVYAGRRSHRAIAELLMPLGDVVLGGRLDLIFPSGFTEVEYEMLSTASFNFERRLWPAAP